MRNGSGSAGSSMSRSPDAMCTVRRIPLARERAATIGVAGVVGAGTRGAIGVAGAPSSPAVRSCSARIWARLPARQPGQDDAGAGRHFDRRRRARAAGIRAAATEHAAARLDPYAVGRAAVGHPPRAFVEPDLAVAPARVLAVDDDVASLAVAHDIAATGNDRRQREWRAPLASSISTSSERPASGVRSTGVRPALSFAPAAAGRARTSVP